jgi:hypothetical protein
MVEIRMVQQMGGRRHDGQEWPEPGELLDVPEWEAEELTRTDEHHSHPIAVRHDEKYPGRGGDLPGLGEPEGTARHAADAAAAERHASPADAENAEAQHQATTRSAEGGITDPTGDYPAGPERPASRKTTAKEESRPARSQAKEENPPARPQAAAGRRSDEGNRE